MTSRRNLISLGLALVALAVGLYALQWFWTSEMTGRYQKAVNICEVAPATGAGRVARLDRMYSRAWRERLPENLRDEARECVLAGPFDRAEDSDEAEE